MATAMASLRVHPQSNTHPPVVATSNDGVLPLDILYDILLRLPTEPICRFRAVCRSWRSLLCHPDYIAAARNPGPLLAVGICQSSWTYEVNILDVESGDALTRFNVAANNDLLSCNMPPYGETHGMSDDHIGRARASRLRFIDICSGTLSGLPNPTLPQDYTFTFTVGRVASTRKQKVLGIATSVRPHEPQICKILTVGSVDAGWKDADSPPLNVVSPSRGKGVAIVNGVAYFMSVQDKSKKLHSEDQIMSFDLDSEVWRLAAAYIKGPANRRGVSLAELDGHLVASYVGSKSVELWFLLDSNRSLWSKRYTITMSSHNYFEKPLAVLDDGRIVMWMRVDRPGFDLEHAMLRIYDPITKTSRDGTHIANCSHLSVFTWSLLHSERRGALDRVAKRLLISRRHSGSGAPSSVGA